MYRVYDKKKKEWVKQQIFLSPQGDLYLFKHVFFFFHRLILASDQRYILHKCADLKDKNGCILYEGDICKSSDDEIGVVTYVPDQAAFFYLVYGNQEYFPLEETMCEMWLDRAGNVFDNPELIQQEVVDHR